MVEQTTQTKQPSVLEQIQNSIFDKKEYKPADLWDERRFTVMEVTPSKEAGKHASKRPVDIFTHNFTTLVWKRNLDKDGNLDLSHFLTFKMAQAAAGELNDKAKKAKSQIRYYPGILINPPYVALDIDDIGNEVKQYQEDSSGLLKDIFQIIGPSYREISQSGNGVHVIYKGKKITATSKVEPYELYDNNRWITLTGNTFKGFDQIEEVSSSRQKQLEKFCFGDKAKQTTKTKKQDLITIDPLERQKAKEYVKTTKSSGNGLTFNEILKAMGKQKNAKYQMARFQRLFTRKYTNDDLRGSDKSQSAADLAFVSTLMWWTNGDVKLVDAIFRTSNLYRDKWDDIHYATGDTYGEQTLATARASLKGGYVPSKKDVIKNKAKEFKEDDSFTIKSTRDLISYQRDLLGDWINAHTDQESKNPKPPRVTAKAIIDILKETMHFGFLYSKSPKETQNAPLSFYDPDTGLWNSSQSDLSSIILAFASDSADSVTSKRKRTDIIESLADDYDIKQNKLKLTRAIKGNERRYLAVANGVLDCKKKVLMPYSPKWVFTSSIDTAYNPNAAVEPSFDGWSLSKMLNELSCDPTTGEILADKHKLLEEVLKAGIMGISDLRQGVWLADDGDGSSGKSTFEEIISNVVGTSSTAWLRLIDVTDGDALKDAVGASLIIGDDNDPHTTINKFDNFNTLISGDVLRVNPKYEHSFSVVLHAFVLQSSNGLPPFAGAVNAAYNRLVIIKFNTHFDAKKQANKNVKYDYIQRKEFKEWLLWHVVNEVELGAGLTQTKESQVLLGKTKTQTDTIAYFVDEVLPNLNDCANTEIPSKFLFTLYYNACQGANLKPLSKPKFMSAIKADPTFNQYWTFKPRNLIISGTEAYLWYRKTADGKRAEDDGLDKDLCVEISNALEHTKKSSHAKPNTALYYLFSLYTSNRVMSFVFGYTGALSYRGSGFVWNAGPEKKEYLDEIARKVEQDMHQYEIEQQQREEAAAQAHELEVKQEADAKVQEDQERSEKIKKLNAQSKS